MADNSGIDRCARVNTNVRRLDIKCAECERGATGPPTHLIEEKINKLPLCVSMDEGVYVLWDCETDRQ